MGSDAASAVSAVWRVESARLVAGLTRVTHDLALAEDLAQDALVAALEQWPSDGIPKNPGAWLMAIAKRRAVDHFRRAETLRRRTAELGHDLEEAHVPDLDAAVDHIEDDVLRLIFLTCHPALPPESRAALTLRLVGGLTTEEIARGFLVKDATVGQRISRAKKTLAGADFVLPSGSERQERLADVMSVIYLIFNEGYSATAGDDWMRPELCLEAIHLARMLADLVPGEPEVHGLQALLEIQASRTAARTGPDGEPVLLEDQDRRLWDQILIRRGFRARARRGARQAGRALCPAGRDRDLSRSGPPPRGHGLGTHRRAVRRPRRTHAQPRRRGQPFRGARPCVRARGRAGGARRPRPGSARAVSPATQRQGRPAGPRRPRRRSGGRLP